MSAALFKNCVTFPTLKILVLCCGITRFWGSGEATTLLLDMKSDMDISFLGVDGDKSGVNFPVKGDSHI